MLNLILGDKRSGKTTYILNKLKGRENSTLIVPEQTLFKYESLILDKLGEENSFLINTLSFKKLAVSLAKDEEKYNEMKLLDNDTRSLIIERILFENKEEMTAFAKTLKKPEFSEKIASQITEFKKYLITYENLSDISKSDSISKGLKEKLSDLTKIYCQYEAYINNLFKDVDDIITFCAKKIIDGNLYKGKTVFIDGFTGFTKDELYMIQAFLLNGAEVYITLPYNKDKKDFPGDLFYSVEGTKIKLSRLCEKIKVKLNEIEIQDNHISSAEIKFLKENYENDEAEYKNYASDIVISECKNIYYECVNLVSDIILNIKNNNAKLSEIAVIVPDIKEYMKYADGILNEFGLSYYCNEKVSVYDMSVAMLLNNLFDIILSSNRIEPLLYYLKSGYFFKNDFDKIYKFENFIRETGIKAYTLFRREFDDIIAEKKLYNFNIDNEEELKEVYNKVILPVINLTKKLKAEKTARGYSLCLYEFFEKTELEKVISEYADDYENDGDLIKGEQLIQVYNYIVESMERASVVLSDCEIKFSEYKDIIISGLKNKNIASVPVLNDSIMICDLAGFCDNSYKYIYILGANEGKIPDTSFSEGIINEEERSELLACGIELSMSYELKLCENYLKLYDALTSSEKRLLISYPIFDKNGDDNVKAQFVKDIANMFRIAPKPENCEIVSKRELLKNSLYDMSKNGEISDSLRYLVNDEEYKSFIEELSVNFGKSSISNVKVSSSKLEKLIGTNLNLSVTNLEKYRSCAFSYFIRYVLKAKEKNEFSINNANLGSLLHMILEMFSRKLKEDNIGFSDIDNDYIAKNLEKIVKKAVASIDNGVFMTDIKSDFLLKKVRRMAEYTINLLKLHFVKGSFEPIAYEMSFGKVGSDAEAIIFDVGKGRKIVLNGVIDRVDKLSSEDGDYIRIVDYKSTGKSVDFYEIFSGIKIQLAVYLLTMLNQKMFGDIKPGGMLYLSLDSPIVKINNPLDTEDLELKIRKEHMMTGIFLNNTDVLTAMDSELENCDKSEIIDVKFDKTGLLNGKNTLSLDEFTYMLSAVTDNVKKEGENIFDGKFSINPVLSGGNSACTYCPYSAVCMFEDGVCGYDVINKIPKEKLFEEMAGGENE